MGVQFLGVRGPTPDGKIPNRVKIRDRDSYSIGILNGAILFAMLDAGYFAKLKPAQSVSYCYGEIPISEARRAIMATRARWSTVPEEVIQGLESQGIRAGFDATDLAEVLARFEKFVGVVSAAGGDHVLWC